jgi:hypothetical protein
VAGMTARRSTGRESDHRAKGISQAGGRQVIDVSAAGRSVRTQLAGAQLGGVLTTAERRVLVRLIVALARLLGETPPH